MARPYEININNGKGSTAIVTGTYSVSANIEGYDNNSIDPKQLQIISSKSEYNLKIAATGRLIIHISDGSGNNIIGATLVRCDAEGQEYGNYITTEDNGNAILENVPYSASGTTIYFKQITSDGEHEFSLELKSKIMTIEEDTIEIINTPAEIKTINLVDANYDNMTIATGTITLS